MSKHIFVLYHRSKPAELIAAGYSELELSEFLMEKYGVDYEDDDSQYVIEPRSIH